MQNKRFLTCIIMAAALLLTLPVELALADNIKLDIVNLNNNYLTLTYEELTAMPKTIVTADLYCYGAIVTNGDWKGVQISYLLAQANATSEVNSITLTASDGYRVAIPISLAMEPTTIIAYGKDEQPLNEGLRLVLPDFNGESWIAMITTLTMSTSGAQAPGVLSTGLGSVSNLTPSKGNLQQNQQQTPTPTLKPAPTATLTSTPQPTNTANNAQENQPTPTVQTSHDAPTSQTMTMWATAIGAVLCAAAVVSTFYARKRKA
jgi:hypothetical protein